MTDSQYFHLRHRAEYHYPEPVAPAYGRLLLVPRAGGGQQVDASLLTIDPTPDREQNRRDFHGNTSTFVQFTEPHCLLRIQVESIVEVTRKPVDTTRLPAVNWEQAAQTVRTVLHPDAIGQAGSFNAAVAVAESRLASPLVHLGEEIRRFAAPSFAPGRGLVDVVAHLGERVAAAIRIRPRSRAGHNGALQALTSGEGTAKDASHLLIAAARSMGLAARYLAGYRWDTDGGDQHAWASVWIPGGGWLHIDPATGEFIDQRYVVLGWGRDAWDVITLRGVTYGATPTSRPQLSITMRPLAADEAAELAIGVRTGAIEAARFVSPGEAW